MRAFETVSVIGVPITRIGMRDLLDAIHHYILSDHTSCKQICITPVNSLLAAHDNDEVMQVYQSSQYVLCDGMPVKWASQILGKPVPERMTGLDVLPALLEEANVHRYRLFLLGASPGVGESLATYIQKHYCNAIVAGIFVPPFKKQFSETDNEQMIHAIQLAKPHIVLVSLTAPKQDIWIAENLKRISAHWAIGIGGAFEVTAGLIPRAPRWMQKCGLEWFFRFLQEPKRMFRRYFVEAPRFIPLVLKQWLRKD